MSGRGRWLVPLIVIMAVACNCATSAAADASIPISSAADLVLPARLQPAQFAVVPAQSYVLSGKVLVSLTGRTLAALFLDHGLIVGYHTVLNGPVIPGAQFVVANFFAFKNNTDALVARTAYHRLIVGTPVIYPNDTLPKSAVVWTYAGTASKKTAYIAARIVFRIANVVCDVTGFYLGADNAAATTALTDAANEVRAYTQWLGGRLPPTKQRSTAPLVPFALAPFIRFGKAR